MKGHKSGVSTQIGKIEPRADTHCYGHSLNLAASDALKSSKLMRDALENNKVNQILSTARRYFS